MINMDYKKIGLKVGLEIHQQLDTKKLFCDCSSSMKEKNVIYEVKRKLRPVVGELGELDRAALFEFFRNRTFIYRGYENETCLVELDEEPPHQINSEALEIALKIALVLGLRVPDELWVMRKLVLDGSAVTSFQRTLLVGIGPVEFEGVRIKSLCLEEDAAKLKDRKGNEVVYSLSRMGIPLIEISTEPDITSPEQCKEFAETLGLLLRSFKVKRGIGSIRQDVNISISGGARIEIKGWQDLWSIDKLIRNEVNRQLNLLKIKEELNRIKAKVEKPIEVKELLNTNVKTFALLLRGFKKVWKRKIYGDEYKKSLRDEIFEYAFAYNSFAFDEESDGMEEDFKILKKRLNAKSEDIIILIYGGEAERAANSVYERACFCLKGIPEETRKPRGDATTSYSRPLPGAARMYPETDHPPIKIEKKLLKKLKTDVPETLIEKKRKLEKLISHELASQIIRSRYFGLFERIVGKSKDVEFIKAVAFTLTSTIKDLRRSGLDIGKVSETDFLQIFNALKNNKISKKAIPEILKLIIEGHETKNAIKKFEKLSKGELRKILKNVIEENRGKPFSAIMGIAMSKIKGRADGKEVMEELKRMLKFNQS